MAPTSLPASGSEEQNAPSLTSPASPNICGHHSPICSGVPFDTTATAARVEPTSDSPIPASPQHSSSTAVTKPSPDSSKNCVAKKSSEYSPIFAASWRTGQGVCSRSSHSAAAGRITPAAKSCTQSRISRRSLLSSRENPGVGSLMLPNSNILPDARKPKPTAIQKKFIPNDTRLRRHGQAIPEVAHSAQRFLLLSPEGCTSAQDGCAFGVATATQKPHPRGRPKRAREPLVG